MSDIFKWEVGMNIFIVPNGTYNQNNITLGTISRLTNTTVIVKRKAKTNSKYRRDTGNSMPANAYYGSKIEPASPSAIEDLENLKYKEHLYYQIKHSVDCHKFTQKFTIQEARELEKLFKDKELFEDFT